jgi:hypothetical protein
VTFGHHPEVDAATVAAFRRGDHEAFDRISHQYFRELSGAPAALTEDPERTQFVLHQGLDDLSSRTDRTPMISGSADRLTGNRRVREVLDTHCSAFELTRFVCLK